MRVTINAVHELAPRVQLRFQNEGSGTEYLAIRRAFVTHMRPDGDYFELAPPCEYIGIQKKRTEYTLDELTPIPPGVCVTSEWVELRNLYEMPQTGLLKVRYVASHPLGGVGCEMQLVVSDWVSLVLG